MVYGIINVVIHTYEDAPDTHSVHKLYEGDDLDILKIELIKILKDNQYKNLVILEVADPMYLKLLGYEHISIFPHCTIGKHGYCRNMITKISYNEKNNNENASKNLMNNTVLAIDEIKQYIKMKNEVIDNNWSKKKVQVELKKLGYKKTVWYRNRIDLQFSYLEKYYLHLLSKY